MQKATHRCVVCSSSNLVPGGHGDMALNQQKHAAPRQWHGRGSEGQVPTQHQHAAPYMYDGPSTLGLKQQRGNSTTQVPCAPHHEVSVKGLSTSSCTKAASIVSGESPEKKIWRPKPIQPWRSNHKMEGGNSFSRCRRPSNKQGNTVLNPKGK